MRATTLLARRTDDRSNHDQLLHTHSFDNVPAFKVPERVTDIEAYFQGALDYLVSQRDPNLQDSFRERLRLNHNVTGAIKLSATEKIIHYCAHLIKNMQITFKAPDALRPYSFSYEEKIAAFKIFDALPKDSHDIETGATPLINYIRTLELMFQASLLPRIDSDHTSGNFFFNNYYMLAPNGYFLKMIFENFPFASLFNNLKHACPIDLENLKITRQILQRHFENYMSEITANEKMPDEHKKKELRYVQIISNFCETGNPEFLLELLDQGQAISLDASTISKLKNDDHIFNIRMKILINQMFPNLIKSNIIPQSIIFLTETCKSLNLPKLFLFLEKISATLLLNGVLKTDESVDKFVMHAFGQLIKAYNMTPEELKENDIDMSIISFLDPIKTYINASKDTLGAIGLSVLLPSIAQVLSSSSLAKDSTNIIKLLNILGTVPGCATKISYPINSKDLVQAVSSLDIGKEKRKIQEILVKINNLLSDPLILSIIENIKTMEYKGFENFINQITILFTQISTIDKDSFFARNAETISFLQTTLSSLPSLYLLSFFDPTSFLPFFLINLCDRSTYRGSIKDLIDNNELQLKKLSDTLNLPKHKLLSLILDVEQESGPFSDVTKVDLSSPYTPSQRLTFQTFGHVPLYQEPFKLDPRIALFNRLEELNLSNNSGLTELPPASTTLRVLNLSETEIDRLDPNIGYKFPKLEELNLNYTKISYLPASLAKLNLRKLAIGSCDITGVHPDCINSPNETLRELAILFNNRDAATRTAYAERMIENQRIGISPQNEDLNTLARRVITRQAFSYRAKEVAKKTWTAIRNNIKPISFSAIIAVTSYVAYQYMQVATKIEEEKS